MTRIITIPKGDDFHLHLRACKILKSVIGFTARQFKRAMIMPNLDLPVLTEIDALQYRQEIMNQDSLLELLMTIKINHQTTPQTIEDAKHIAIAGKLYPEGVTNNSQNGVTNFHAMYPVFEKMQEVGMVLSLHGEDPDPETFCLDREISFLPTFACLAEDFPKLKIVLEHITTREAVEMVLRLPKNVAATITVHHLAITLNDVIGGLISPHNFCKPVAQRPSDRKALLEAATSGDPKFFCGSDSAPHLKEKKECSCGCAGIYNAPVAIPSLVQSFEKQNALDKLNNFIGKFGAEYYGLNPSNETIDLIEKDWVVPQEYNGIVPFMADQTLHWKVV